MNHKVTRRQFIGTGAASAFAFTFLPSRVWGANERVYVASIGVGGKGSSDVSGVDNNGGTIVALCDVDRARAKGSFKKYPYANRYRDFRKMLEKEQKAIDAVTVSTPDHTHAHASIMAMEMGKHVYCQKPLTHSVWEARRMAEVARKQGVVTQMGNQAHSGEPIRRGVELIRAGVIGNVKEVYTWTNRPIWPQGITRPEETPDVPDHLAWDLWLGPAPWRPYHPAYVPFKWRGWWDFGTGALGDMACHIMDMAYWSLDLGAPETVDAESGGMTKESPPNWSTVSYQFPARGYQPPVKYYWYDGKKENGNRNLPPDDVLEGEDPGQWDCVLIGDKGKMWFKRGGPGSDIGDDFDNSYWKIRSDRDLSDFKAPPKVIPRTKNEDYEWVQGIKGGPTPLSNFTRSGPFTETVLLGNLAIRLNKRLEWDSHNLKATNAPEADQYIKREYREGWRFI